MDKQKSNRKNYGTAYYAMAFLAAFFFEFYWIMTNPYEYFMLLGIGIIMIIMGYLTIDSILKAKADSDAQKNEQNEMMLKAQKAIYIATKKNAKDTEFRQNQSLKAVELMMNKMISSQQALLEEKKPADNDMSSLIDQLSASNAKLAKEVQSAITVNQLVKANADLVRNVKEALSASALGGGSSAADLSSYVNEAIGATPEPMFTPEPEVIPEPMFTPEPEIIPEPEIVSEPDDSLNEFDMSEIASDDNMDAQTMTDIEDEINLASMEESEALEDITIPDEMTPELDAAMTDVDITESGMSDAEQDVSAADINTDEDPVNPFASQVDDSPNRQLTEEEIAALFASL